MEKVVDCWICGKGFIVKTDKSGKLLTKCFHSKLPKHFFLGWTYSIKFTKKSFKVSGVNFKNLFWKIVGYTKFQRRIIYHVWRLFKGWQKIDYWECPRCRKK